MVSPPPGIGKVSVHTDIQNVTLPQGYPTHGLPNCVTRPMATFVYFTHACTHVRAHTHTHIHTYIHTYIEVGLILCQGYVPEKHHTNQTQNSNLNRISKPQLKRV